MATAPLEKIIALTQILALQLGSARWKNKPLEMDGFRLLALATAPRELGVFKPGCQIVVSVSCSKVVSQKYLRVLSVLCWFIIAHGLALKKYLFALI